MKTTRVRVRSIAAGTAAALLLSPLAACGSDQDNGGDAKSTSSETSASAEPSESASPTEADSDAAETGKKINKDNFAEVLTAAMRKQETAHMTMKMGAALDAEGDVRYGADGNEMKMTMGMGQQKATMIFVDDTLYMQMPGMTQPGKWTKVTGDDPTLGSMVDQMNGMGPEASLDVMKKGLKDVRYIGKEGDLQHYKVTVDTSAAMDSLGGMAEGAQGNAPQEITYDMYVDQDNLMRKLVMNFMDQQMVMEVTQWGHDVDIQAPPAGDVVQMPGSAG